MVLCVAVGAFDRICSARSKRVRDYDFDGMTDWVMFPPSSHVWFVEKSEAHLERH